MKDKVSGHTHSQQQLNHHANQCNPNNSFYRAAQDNRANQLNPNNSEYRGSSGQGKSNK